MPSVLRSTGKFRGTTRKIAHSIAEQIKSSTREKWTGSLLDLHRVFNAALCIFLLLEEHNEPVIRVAVELVTDPACKKFLRWNREAWYGDDSQREWFRKAVHGKLDNVFHMRSVLSTSKTNFSRRGSRERTRTEEELLEKLREAEARVAALGQGHMQAQEMGEERRRTLQEQSEAAEARAEALEKQLEDLRAEAAAALARAKASEMKLAQAGDAPGLHALGSGSAEKASWCIKELESTLQEERANAASREAALREKLKSVKEENGRLNVAVEELKRKLQKMLARAQESGDAEFAKVNELLSEAGLTALVRVKSVWDRLYDEAKDRIQRMERLRQDYRSNLGLDPFQGEEILEALEQSDLAHKATEPTTYAAAPLPTVVIDGPPADASPGMKRALTALSAVGKFKGLARRRNEAVASDTPQPTLVGRGKIQPENEALTELSTMVAGSPVASAGGGSLQPRRVLITTPDHAVTPQRVPSLQQDVPVPMQKQAAARKVVSCRVRGGNFPQAGGGRLVGTSVSMPVLPRRKMRRDFAAGDYQTPQEDPDAASSSALHRGAGAVRVQDLMQRQPPGDARDVPCSDVGGLPPKSTGVESKKKT